MKKLLDKLNFKRQWWLAFGIAMCCFILANLLHLDIISNVGWVLAGLLFIVHPRVPESAKWRYGGDEKRMARDSRIAGIVVIILGIVTRFGI